MFRILLVEDDSAIVDTLAELLRSEGYATAQAARQDDALALLQAERFDLALVDIALAQGNGFAVCSAAPGPPVRSAWRMWRLTRAPPWCARAAPRWRSRRWNTACFCCSPRTRARSSRASS